MAAPAAAFGILICMLPDIYADPFISSATSIDQNVLNVSITGSGLPELQGITLICSYAPDRALLMDAIISSPLPSTAFSASIDTSEQLLIVSVCATGSIRIADGTSLVILRIPLSESQEGESAFSLDSATLTDVSGATHFVSVGSTAVAIPPQYRFNTATVAQTSSRATGFFLINGKLGRFGVPCTAAGIYIRRRRNLGTTIAITIRR